jgi:hypothetical protein
MVKSNKIRRIFFSHLPIQSRVEADGNPNLLLLVQLHLGTVPAPPFLLLIIFIVFGVVLEVLLGPPPAAAEAPVGVVERGGARRVGAVGRGALLLLIVPGL